MLLGGKKSNTLYQTGIIAADIQNIYKIDQNRALEISAFYFDLEKSIKNVANSVKSKGIVIYIVGNRRVKDIQLLTDQFIAEQFEKSGFNHLITYERLLSNKVMPSKNSPSNKSGITKATMTQEFIVVCEKK
ncbi:MAG: hypothetical protein RL637_839 [Pseudomonadota bacterium]|jgi:hypothetical protein